MRLWTERRSQQPPMASEGRQKLPADAAARQADWLALPDLPLSFIAQRLHTLKDFLSFCGVCTSWRSLGRTIEGAITASFPPLLFEYTLNRFYHPAERRLYKKPAAVEAFVAGYSQGHLILAHDGMPWLLNPLTGAESHCFPRVELFFCQAVLSSTPTSPGCVLVAYDSCRVQYCRPGDKEWRVVYQPRDQMGNPLDNVSCVSIVGEKGYVLLDALRLATFDFTDHLELTVLKAEPLQCVCVGACSAVFLAESKGELFAFSTLRLHPAGEFVVSRFDSLSCKWVSSEDLGGRAVFVDRWRGYVFVDNYAKWGGSKDCIYFFESSQRLVLEYKVKDGTSKPFLFPTGSLAVDGFTGVWVLPRLF